MRIALITLFVVLAIDLAVDAYIYLQCRKRCKRPMWAKLQLVSAALLVLLMIVGMVLPARGVSSGMLLAKMWVLFSYMSVYLPKYIAVVFDLLASLPRLWRRPRVKWLTTTGIVVAAALFGTLWWGALVNRNRTRVHELEVEIPHLPSSFNGFRVVQISDMHLGTYGSDTTFVSHLVDEVNSLGADAILFTGDIVNRQSSEMFPFIPVLSRLHAPAGVYAILGNHDYGDYRNWANPEEKASNMEQLYDAYASTGIDLLRNTHRWLRCAADSIALIGVENIGDPPFKIYGSLPKSYPTLGDSIPKILLSHNPQHWVDSIADNPRLNIPLTLSGHTHAMQIEVAGVTPAVFRYPTWGGLFTDESERSSMYVNIGTGTVGLPMRIGATPEITIITLRPKQ